MSDDHTSRRRVEIITDDKPLLRPGVRSSRPRADGRERPDHLQMDRHGGRSCPMTILRAGESRLSPTTSHCSAPASDPPTRGPMGANDLTTYKWIVTGDGHVR